MANYGLRALLFTVTPPYKPDEPIHLDSPEFGDGGFYETLKGLIDKLVAGSGGRDDRRSTYARLDQLRGGGQLVLVDTSSGIYGETAEIVDSESGDQEGLIETRHAVLHQGRGLFVVPPSGTTGLLLSEVVGRRTASAALGPTLKNPMLELGAVLRFESDVADNHAWGQYLDSDEVGVAAVELVQHHPSSDSTPLTSNPAVRSASITVNLDPSSNVVKDIVAAVWRGHRDRTAVRLAPLVGVENYDSESFDDQSIVVVVDKKRRTIKVSTGWPMFTYHIDTEDRPDDETFVTHACDIAADLLKELEIDMPPGWRSIDL